MTSKPDYTGYAMYQQAMRAHGQAEFAVWLCETYPWGGVDMDTAHSRWVLQRVAGELADFTPYPPEENTSDGPCYLCGGQVLPAGGVVALGGHDGRNFAVCLHHGCAAQVREAQASASQASKTRRASQ
jgi:hypothetical protein